VTVEPTLDLYCGDWRDVLLSLGLDEKNCVLLTDPPYGINHDTDYTRFTGGANAPRAKYRPIEGDKDEFDPTPFLGYGKVVLWGANNFMQLLRPGSLFVWDKRTVNRNKAVMSDAEVARYGSGHGVYIFSHTWDGFNRASERGTAFHPNQKPVALMRWCIEKIRAERTMTVVDPFMGSGPVGVACAELGFNYVGVEKDAGYFEIAKQRVEKARTCGVQTRIELD